MKSLVYEPDFFDRSDSNFLNEMGRKIGITHKLKIRDIKDPDSNKLIILFKTFFSLNL